MTFTPNPIIDATTTSTITAANQSVTITNKMCAAGVISVSGTFTGVLSVQATVDPTVSNPIWNGLLLFRVGVGPVGINTITGVGNAVTAEYRFISGMQAVRIVSGSTWSGSVTITMGTSSATTMVFINGPVQSSQESAARAGRNFTTSTGVASVNAGSYLNSYLSNPVASGVNLFVYKITFGTTATSALQFTRIGTPTNAGTAAPTALAVSNSIVGSPAGSGLAFSGTSTTALAGTVGAAGIIPANGMPREINLGPTKLLPGQSFGYFVGGTGGGLTATSLIAVTYSWYEEITV